MLNKKVLLQITLMLCLVTFVSDVFAEPISKNFLKMKNYIHRDGLSAIR